MQSINKLCLLEYRLLIVSIEKLNFIIFLKMENHCANLINQKQKYQKERPRSSFVTLAQPQENQLKQFSINMFSQIGNQLSIGCEVKNANDNKNLLDEQQPPSSGVKWKASKVRSKDQSKKSIKLVPQRKIRNFQRISFGMKFQKFENKSLHCLNFPSQKTLLSKEKVLPIKRAQKQKYVVEICRIFKQNCNTIFKQNNKQNQAFVSNQVQKYRQIKTDSKYKNPIVTFNYDGSILTVNPLKKAGAQTIQCTGRQTVQAIIKPIHIIDQQHKDVNKAQNGKKYEEIQKLSSKYIDNFRKIAWSPKITVIYEENSKLGCKNSNKNKNRHLSNNNNCFDFTQFHRCRANTVKLKKQNQDEKSVIKIENKQAYEEQLLVKPKQTYHVRSASCDFSEDNPKISRLKTDQNFYRKKSKVHHIQILDPQTKQKSNNNKKKKNQRSFHIPAPQDNQDHSNKISSSHLQNSKMINSQLNYSSQTTNKNNLNQNLRPSNFIRSKSAHIKKIKDKSYNENSVHIYIDQNLNESAEFLSNQIDNSQINIKKQYINPNKSVKQILKKFQFVKSSEGTQIKKSRNHQRATSKLYH